MAGRRDGQSDANNQSPQDLAAGPAWRQARQVAGVLRQRGVLPGARVLDLCCGYGRQASTLAKAGYDVVGVDIRHDPALIRQWKTRMARPGRLRLVSGDARCLPLRGRFEATLLLASGLSLFADNDDAVPVFLDLRRLMAPKGLLLLDNVCLRIWQEIAAGRYASGLSEDGLWQMAWLTGRNVFALRYGDQVRPRQARPRRGEAVYRAWSQDELDLLCRLTGWLLEPASRKASLLVLRPERT